MSECLDRLITRQLFTLFMVSEHVNFSFLHRSELQGIRYPLCYLCAVNTLIVVVHWGITGILSCARK